MKSDPTRMQGLAEFAIENLADAAYFVRADSTILYANAAATKMLGYTREEFLTMRIYDFNPEVTLASGYSLAGDTRALLEAGAAGFVQKPYRKATLAEKLAELLGETATAS